MNVAQARPEPGQAQPAVSRRRTSHRGRAAGEALRRQAGAGRSGSGCRPRDGVRTAGAEQHAYNHGADPGHPARPGRRPGPGQAGHDVAAEPRLVRRAIALTGQVAAVDEDLTGQENLVSRPARWPPAPDRQRRAGRTAGRVRAVEAAGRPAETYSGGMRRRLDIAVSLTVTPECCSWTNPPRAGPAAATRSPSWSAPWPRRHDRAADHPVPDRGRRARRPVAVIDHGR